MTTYPMQWVWRFALVLLIGVGLVAIGAAGLELSGIVADGTLFKGSDSRGSGDTEKWIAVVVGLLLQPFGWTALRHARLSLDEHELRYLGFGFVCKTRSIALKDVRRWGHAVTRSQRRRERTLLVELQDLSTKLVKIEMYARNQELLEQLTQRLGPATPAKPTIGGVTFEEQ